MHILKIVHGRLYSHIILSPPFNVIFILSFEVKPACDGVAAAPHVRGLPPVDIGHAW